MNKTNTATYPTAALLGARVFDGDQVPIGTVTQVQKDRVRVRALLRDFWLSTRLIRSADVAGVWLSLPELFLVAELPPLPRYARPRTHRRVAA